MSARAFVARSLVFSAVLACSIAFAAFSHAPLSQAAFVSAHNVTGYAWSSTAGWISFNCDNTNTCNRTDYGVSVDSNGMLSGYAWNDTVGWISFNQSSLAGCPSGICHSALSHGVLTGWARVLSAAAEDADFSGWISLSGASYGPTLSGASFSGYAWGSDVLGWISFDTQFGRGVAVKPNVEVSLVAEPATVTQGKNITLSWTSTNARSCAGNGFSTKGALQGSASVTPLSSRSYTVICDGVGGSSSAGASVGVIPALPEFRASPAILNEGNRTELSWSCPFSSSSSGGGFSTGGAVSGSISLAPATTTPYILRCDPYGGQATVLVDVLHPQLSLQISPALVRSGDTPTIAWSASLVEKGSCRLIGPGLDRSGESGSSVLPPVSAQSSYTFTCGTRGGLVSVSRTVNLIPHFQ